MGFVKRCLEIKGGANKESMGHYLMVGGDVYKRENSQGSETRLEFIFRFRKKQKEREGEREGERGGGERSGYAV